MTEQADVGDGQLSTEAPPPTVTERPEVNEGRSVTEAAPADVTGRRCRPAWLLGTVAAGWLVSGLAVLAGVDWVLLPLLVLAVASTLRTGRGLLDRLMLATVLLAGLLVAGGLLYSFSPWGLAPFPVAGSLFTAVAVGAWAGRRRPRLPLAVS
ncbi:MAG: hypothetical protein JWO67_3741, partial [Streptosporangiaceae bacterium]|nr:hypothetical protein [Streptosporangiaceae bacterium]